MDEVFDVLILGAGAAGLTAGIYSSRAKLDTLILNEGAVGGQIVLTDEIVNYPGEDTFNGTGISYCATCDGDFFAGKEIILVGGENSALEEAVTLTNFASKVAIVHQFTGKNLPMELSIAL
ncbi:Ferredoxin--NADP reductase [subsurface metagenome]